MRTVADQSHRDLSTYRPTTTPTISGVPTDKYSSSQSICANNQKNSATHHGRCDSIRRIEGHRWLYTLVRTCRYGNHYVMSIAKNVAVVATGAVVTNLITIAATPLLTRLFGPDLLGYLGVFTSYVTIGAVAVGARFELSFLLPEESSTAIQLRKLFHLVACATSLISVAIVTLLLILDIHGFEEIGGSTSALLLPLGFFVVGSAAAEDQLALRSRLFKRSATAAIVGTCISMGVMVVGGTLRPSGGILITGFIVNYISRAVVLRSRPNRTDLKVVKTKVRDLLPLLRAYRDFPLFRAPQDLINALAQNVPLIVIGSSFGVEAAGLYWLSHRVIKLPSNVLSESIRKVFYQDLAAVSHLGGPIHPRLLRTTAMLALIFTLGAILVFFFAAPVFDIVFGPEWSGAASMARWIMVAVAMQVANVPAVVAVPILRIQHRKFVFEIVNLAAIVGAAVVGVAFELTIVNFVVLVSVTTAIMYFIHATSTLIYAIRHGR